MKYINIKWKIIIKWYIYINLLATLDYKFFYYNFFSSLNNVYFLKRKFKNLIAWLIN